MCRMCLVEIDTGRGPALQPSCMIECAPGHGGRHRVARSPRRPRTASSSSCSINHPLDCPVCDKGGECPLQDQTMAYGPGESRFVEEKRHYEKPIPISDLVLPRPRALHPVRPLHPVRQGGRRRPADPLHRPRQRHRGQHLPRRAVRRRTSAATPCRSARWARSPPRPTGSRPARGTSTRSSPPAPTCSVGCRVAVAVVAQRGAALPGRRHRPGQLGLAVRQGPLRLRGGQQRRPARRAAGARRRRARRRRRWADALGRGRRRARAGRRRRRPGGDRRARRRPAHQRGRLRLGQAGQGRHRHRQRRRPARRRPAGRGRARPAPRHHRRGLRARAAPSLLLGPDLKEELPVLFLRLRHAVVERRRHGHRAHARSATGLTPLAAASLHAPPGRGRRRGAAALLAGAAPHRGRRRRARRHRRRRGALARRRARSPSCSAGQSLAESADARRRRRVGAARRAAPDVRFLPRAAPRQRARRARHGPGPGPAARPGHASTTAAPGSPSAWPGVPADDRPRRRAASSRPRPTAGSTCSCCSAPTRSPTSPTATSPRGPSPAPAR